MDWIGFPLLDLFDWLHDVFCRHRKMKLVGVFDDCAIALCERCGHHIRLEVDGGKPPV
jgi:hypothetical protein